MSRTNNGTTFRWVEFGSSSNPNPASVSISLWVMGTGSNSGAGVAIFASTTPLRMWSIYSNGTSFTYRFNNDGVTINGSATLSNNVWYSVVLSCSSSTGINVYVNGVSDGTSGTNYNNGFTPNIGYRVLGDVFNNPFTGQVADLGVWSVALTSREAVSLSQGARPGLIRPNALICWGPMTGLAGLSPEPDISGNKLNGVVTGAIGSGADPPISMLTPRWPQNIAPAAASSTAVFRKSLSSIGTRVGSRQMVAS